MSWAATAPYVGMIAGALCASYYAQGKQVGWAGWPLDLDATCKVFIDGGGLGIGLGFVGGALMAPLALLLRPHFQRAAAALIGATVAAGGGLVSDYDAAPAAFGGAVAGYALVLIMESRTMRRLVIRGAEVRGTIWIVRRSPAGGEGGPPPPQLAVDSGEANSSGAARVEW